MPLVANHQAPKVSEPGKQPLHLPSPLVPTELTPVLGRALLSSFAMWGYHLDAFRMEGRVEWVGVVSAIADQPVGLLPYEAALKGFCDERNLMRRRTRSVHSHGKTRAVCYRHELRSLSSLGLPDAASSTFGRHERRIDEA